MCILLPLVTLAQEGFDGFSQLAGNKGGKRELKRVFNQEVVYPEKSLAENVGGKVVFKFIVMKDGNIREIRKIDSVNSEIDAEALRILNMLEWTPSIYKGDSVNSFIDVEFKFNPKQYKRIVKDRGYDKIVYPIDYTAFNDFRVFTKVDEQAVYVNGSYALADFMQKNIEYPKVAQMQRITGTVLLSFVVEPSGYPTNIHLIKSLGFGCDEEAIRVAALTKWKPATLNGKVVRSRISFPVAFYLNESFKDNSHGEQK